MFDHGREGEFRGGHSVGAGFARQVNRGCEADRGVFSVVSPGLTRRIVLDFRRFKREGRTVVYVTHDLATVERFCDRALWLERLIIYMKSKPGVWFATHEEVATYLKKVVQ